MKHLSNYAKVPFGQFNTSISTFLIVFCNGSRCAHILMKSALLTRNRCNKYLFVDRNSYQCYLRKEHLMSFQKQSVFPPLMLHISKFQVVYKIHDIGIHLCGKFLPCKDFFSYFMLILMIFDIFLNLDFVHSMKTPKFLTAT